MSRRPGDPGYAAGWCIHFRDTGRYKTCEVGVPYSNFAETPFMSRPCFLTEHGTSTPDAAECEHLRRPTAEEIAAHDKWVAGRIGRLSTAMEAAAPFRAANKGRNAATVIECPICKGRLHLSIAASNGHVHGACETPDCVRWME